MSKFHGMIGFSISSETSPGVWTNEIIEKSYSGDLVSNRRMWNGNDQVNEDLTISATINVLANQFLNLNMPNMKYVIWMGCKWKISSIEASYPRVSITLGGLYNE